MTISLRPDKRAMRRLEKELKDVPKQFNKLAVRAINKTAKKHATAVKKKLRTYVRVKQASLKDIVYVSSIARGEILNARVTVSKTARPSLKAFGAKQNKKGVSYKISKSERGFRKGHFIGRGKLNGHVYKRRFDYVPNPDGDAALRRKNRMVGQKRKGPTMISVFEKNKMARWSNKAIRKEFANQIDIQIRSYRKKRL